MLSIQQIVGGYAIWLIVFGVAGNALAMVICYRLRKNHTFIFLTFITFSDIAASINWNLNLFSDNILLSSIQSSSLTACKIQNFIQYSAFQISAWLLVLMSVERLLTVKVIRWKIFFKPRHAVLVCSVCLVCFLIINSSIIVSFGLVETVNGTETVICFPTNSGSFIDTWGTVNSFLYSFGPFSALAITNFLLIREIKKKRVHGKSASASKKQTAMSRTVILVTLFFIIMTLPSAIMTTIMPYIVHNELVIGLLHLSFAFSLSYNAYGLVILFFTNKRFSQALRVFFWARNEVFPSSTGNTGTIKD